MRILIVTTSLPYPPASGGAIRVYGILKGLHAQGHQITLMSFHDKSTVPAELSSLCEQIITLPTPQRSRLDRIQTLLFSQRADIETRFYDAAFAEQLKMVIRDGQFDLIQFEAIEAACYLPDMCATYPDVTICFDTFNAEADLQRVIYDIDRQEIKRWPQAVYSYIQSRRIKRYEGALCCAADLVIAVSEEDQMLLSTYRNDQRTRVVPSGIFVDDYAISESTVTLPQPSVVFSGKMDYRPNVDAMLWYTSEIMPRIPQSHLTIVGQKPHARLQTLADHPKITITGWVDAVLPYLHAADVYIAPLRMGSGTRLKILEAMAAGCAIVATTTAAAGLSDAARAAMVIADDAHTFATAIRELLADDDRRAELGLLARQRVKAEYDWSVLIPRLLDAYREVGLG